MSNGKKYKVIVSERAKQMLGSRSVRKPHLQRGKS